MKENFQSSLIGLNMDLNILFSLILLSPLKVLQILGKYKCSKLSFERNNGFIHLWKGQKAGLFTATVTQHYNSFVRGKTGGAMATNLNYVFYGKYIPTVFWKNVDCDHRNLFK